VEVVVGEMRDEGRGKRKEGEEGRGKQFMFKNMN